MNQKSLYTKRYRDKHQYAPEEYNGPYVPWEDLIIHFQKNPTTREYMTLAEIAKLRARTLRSVEGRKRWLRKHPGHVLMLLGSPDKHYEKLEESYINFLKGTDRYGQVRF